MRIVFVCLGNICRSPMAEAVFRQLAAQAGIMDRIQIDSAATSSWNEGQPVHIGTKTILDTYGYVSDGLISRPLTKADGTADFLIGMDAQNIQDIHRIVGKQAAGHIVSLLHFAGRETDIADPWYTGDFEQTYRDVLAGCRGLLAHISELLSA